MRRFAPPLPMAPAGGACTPSERVQAERLPLPAPAAPAAVRLRSLAGSHPAPGVAAPCIGAFCAPMRSGDMLSPSYSCPLSGRDSTRRKRRRNKANTNHAKNHPATFDKMPCGFRSYFERERERRCRAQLLYAVDKHKKSRPFVIGFFYLYKQLFRRLRLHEGFKGAVLLKYVFIIIYGAIRQNYHNIKENTYSFISR